MIFINGTACPSGLDNIKVIRMHTASRPSPLPPLIFSPPGSEFAGDPLEKEHQISIHRDYIAVTQCGRRYFRTVGVILNIFQSIKLIFPDSSVRWTDWFWHLLQRPQTTEGTFTEGQFSTQQ